ARAADGARRGVLAPTPGVPLRRGWLTVAGHRPVLPDGAGAPARPGRPGQRDLLDRPAHPGDRVGAEGGYLLPGERAHPSRCADRVRRSSEERRVRKEGKWRTVTTPSNRSDS